MEKKAKSFHVEICKDLSTADTLYGYAIVCKELNDEGQFEDYFDTQGDHITEPYMKTVADNFMFSSRVAKFQHDGDQIGLVIHSLPVTEELADRLGWTISKTGWVIGMKPDDDAIIKAYQNGAITGFSIGGFIHA